MNLLRGRARSDERGAALVEFALVLPLLVVLLMGIINGGLMLNRRLQVTHAGREAARYGATVAPEQCTPASECSGRTWAQQVRDVAVRRADGVLTAADICVALVEGPGTSPLPLSTAHTTQPSLTPCYVDDSVDTGPRVQVLIRYHDEIDAALFRVPIDVNNRATAKLEQ